MALYGLDEPLMLALFGNRLATSDLKPVEMHAGAFLRVIGKVIPR